MEGTREAVLAQREATVNLTVTWCWCGLPFAVPSSLARMHNEEGHGIFCPLGHETFRKKTDNKKLREELEVQRQNAKYWQERTREERETVRRIDRRLSATRGVVTRIKKRIHAGTCPHCRRTFQNVANHMKNMHPEKVEESRAK